MWTQEPSRRHAIAAILLVGVLAGLASLMGCRTPSGARSQPVAAVASGKSDVQLWSENCGRCHNLRDPSSYSDAQWDVSMHQMRVRAILTADEYARVLAFLKSSN